MKTQLFSKTGIRADRRSGWACVARPPVPLYRRAAALAGALAFAGAGYAAAEPYKPGNLPSDQLSQVGRICESVMRLQPGEAHYAGCVESLSYALKSLNRERAVARAHEDCLGEGLKRDTPELADCVLKSAAKRPAPAPDLRFGRENEPAAPGSGKSYFYASPRMVRRREELSCARLSLEPGTGAFASCVANLQSALFAADNPKN